MNGRSLYDFVCIHVYIGDPRAKLLHYAMLKIILLLLVTVSAANGQGKYGLLQFFNFN